MLDYLVVTVAAFIGYVISTIGGGGGSLLLVPVLTFVLGSRAVAPVLKERSFPMRAVFFLPLGFFVSMISALIGATGPVLNPFYLNYGVEKEEMIATKTVNSFLAGLFQTGTYSAFGVLPRELWGYGIAIGIAAGIASYIGKRILGEMESKTFRRIVIAVMVVSGIALIHRQLFGGDL